MINKLFLVFSQQPPWVYYADKLIENAIYYLTDVVSCIGITRTNQDAWSEIHTPPLRICDFAIEFPISELRLISSP